MAACSAGPSTARSGAVETDRESPAPLAVAHAPANFQRTGGDTVPHGVRAIDTAGDRPVCLTPPLPARRHERPEAAWDLIPAPATIALSHRPLNAALDRRRPSKRDPGVGARGTPPCCRRVTRSHRECCQQPPCHLRAAAHHAAAPTDTTPPVGHPCHAAIDLTHSELDCCPCPRERPAELPAPRS